MSIASATDPNPFESHASPLDQSEHPAAGEISLIPPREVRLRLAESGSLELLTPDRGAVIVIPRSCFPWQNSKSFISLRDKEGNEHALIERPDELDTASRAALEDARRVSTFTFEITRIDKLDREIELRVWQVQTSQGERQFQTELDEWPVLLSDGSLLITDIIGDLYRIHDYKLLDSRSQRLLWGFLN